MAPLQALNPAAPADPKCTGQLAKSRSLFLNQLIEALASDTFQPQGGTGLQVFYYYYFTYLTLKDMTNDHLDLTINLIYPVIV